MKLSKVQRVIDTFDIKNIGDYQVDNLDLNRAPNPPKASVTLLLDSGERKQLEPPELTRFEANRNDLMAVEVHLGNKKMLLID